MPRALIPTLPLCLLGVAALLAGGCNTLTPATGPTVGIRNDSDAPLKAQFWVGERARQLPGLRVNMDADEVLDIPPYRTKRYKLGAFSGYDSPAASFVRVHIEQVTPSFAAQGAQWFEFGPPAPYTIRVSGTKANLRFERVGPGTMVQVPEDRWFKNGTTPLAPAAPITATAAVPGTTAQ